ncbi:MAG: hypothetical protein KatS3mg077_2685 [Candidatus Binatia bacterium]|nr:MAG: hypothetical protein KatS3mg077_2685 [Candidatus Binatia bacterium]
MACRPMVATAVALLSAIPSSALILTVPPASAAPGGPVAVLVVASDSGNRAVGLQVDLSIPEDVLAFDGCSIDPTLAALGFMLSAGRSPWNPGKMRLVLLPTPDGLAAGARLPDGPIATCAGSIYSTATPGRTVSLTLSNAMAVDAAPNSLPVSVESGSLTIAQPSAPPGAPVCALLPPGQSSSASGAAVARGRCPCRLAARSAAP